MSIGSLAAAGSVVAAAAHRPAPSACRRRRSSSSGSGCANRRVPARSSTAAAAKQRSARATTKRELAPWCGTCARRAGETVRRPRRHLGCTTGRLSSPRGEVAQQRSRSTSAMAAPRVFSDARCNGGGAAVGRSTRRGPSPCSPRSGSHGGGHWVPGGENVLQIALQSLLGPQWQERVWLCSSRSGDVGGGCKLAAWGCKPALKSNTRGSRCGGSSVVPKQGR